MLLGLGLSLFLGLGDYEYVTSSHQVSRPMVGKQSQLLSGNVRVAVITIRIVAVVMGHSKAKNANVAGCYTQQSQLKPEFLKWMNKNTLT